MTYNFEKIIIECMAENYGIDVDCIDEMQFDGSFIHQYRLILDKLFCGLVKELIESEKIYKIMMRRLTVMQRICIVLYCFFDLSYDEIADALFTSKQSVKQQKSKGLIRIKQSLKHS